MKNSALKHYHYSYIGAIFFMLTGSLAICFYKFLPASLIDVVYKGEGFEVKTTSIGVFFIIVGLVMFIFSLFEHRNHQNRETEKEDYKFLLSKYRQLLDYHNNSGTSISVTKEEEVGK